MNIDALKGVIASGGGLALANLFQVDLPSMGTMASNELNLLCKEVTLPGRQVMTMEYPIGTKTEKIGYGVAMDDVSMSFIVPNDYKVRRYFEDWQRLAYNPEAHEIGYKSQYARQIQIHQLKKGVSFPVINRDFGSFEFLSGLTLDVDISIPSSRIYSCTLQKAWPVTIESVPLSNELDGLIELRTQFSYVTWTSTFY